MGSPLIPQPGVYHVATFLKDGTGNIHRSFNKLWYLRKQDAEYLAARINSGVGYQLAQSESVCTAGEARVVLAGNSRYDGLTKPGFRQRNDAPWRAQFEGSYCQRLLAVE